MTQQSITVTVNTDRSPQAAFAAIVDPRRWWDGEIEGAADEVGAEFTYRYADLHRSTQRVTEIVPGRRVVWHVVEGYLSFVADAAEWAGTDIVFDLEPTPDGTEIRFTHVGITPDVECFTSCDPAWHHLVGARLPAAIATLEEDAVGRPA